MPADRSDAACTMAGVRKPQHKATFSLMMIRSCHRSRRASLLSYLQPQLDRAVAFGTPYFLLRESTGLFSEAALET
jgi:hypothetical protein